MDRQVSNKSDRVDQSERKPTDNTARNFQRRESTAKGRPAQKIEAWRASEERFNSLAETMNDGIITISEDGTVCYVNHAAQGMFGYLSSDELLGQKWTMLLSEASGQDLMASPEHYLTASEASHSANAIQASGRHKSGRAIQLEITFGEYWSGGKRFFTGIIRDVSEHERRHKTRRRDETLFHTLVEHSFDAVVLIGADATIQYASPATTRISGYASSDFIGHNIFEFMHPQDIEEAVQLFSQLLQQPGASASGEFRYRHKDGSWVWIAGTGINLLTQPSVQAVVANYHDITEQKQTEEARRRAEAKYRTVFENAVEGIYQTSREGGMLMANPALAAMLGYASAEELIAAITDSQQQLYVEPERRAELTRLLEQNDVVRGFEFQAYKKDRQTIWLNANMRAVRSENDEMLCYEGLVTDISERKLVEQEAQHRSYLDAALLRMASRISDNPGMQTIADALCEEAARALDVPMATVSLYDKDQCTLQEVSRVGLPLDDGSHTSPLAPSLYDQLAQGISPDEIFENTQRFTISNPDQVNPWSIGQTASAALLHTGELIGLLSVITPDESRQFSEDDQHLLRQLAKQAAQAMAIARLFEQLRDAKQRLEMLSRQLVESQELERRRLAVHLHDEIGQNLTGLGINFNIIRNQLPAELAEKMEKRLNDCMMLLEVTVQRSRELMVDLRPSVLDDYGLPAALRWYVQRFAERTNLNTSVDASNVVVRLPADVETAFFRVAQEALTNVSKHAHASHVYVALIWQDGDVHLSVKDDGIGFDPMLIKKPVQQGGMGLVSMDERAEAIGASLRVYSTAGNGTLVRLTMSVPHDH